MMKIFTSLDFKINEPTVVTIGKFDGDHRGHQTIFKTMREIKAATGYKIAAFTFNSSQIVSSEEKHILLQDEGIDYLIEVTPDEEIMSIEGTDFIKRILVQLLNMKEIVAGSDCSFGHNKSGNAELLMRFEEECGYKVTIIDKITDEKGKEINSTMIRELISKGKIDEAKDLLGNSSRFLK